MLASAVETLAEIFEGYVAKASKSSEDVLAQRLPLVLGVMVAMARSVPENTSSKQGAQARCISCLQSSLSSAHPLV